MQFISTSPLLRAALVATVVAAQTCPALAAAPQQLYNKTININWTVAVTRGADEGHKVVPVAVNHTVYVSSAGRLFERGSRTTKRGSRATDNAPGATHNKGGEATGVHFEGNRLVGITAFAQGGRRFVATFDPSFSSCTVAVAFGREAGGLKRRGIDGGMHTIASMTASGESCSIRDGNAFGE
jgi:hypothetical protein